MIWILLDGCSHGTAVLGPPPPAWGWWVGVGAVVHQGAVFAEVPPAGLSAFDASTGAVLWHTDAADRPLAVDEHRVAAQVHRLEAGLEVVVLDRADGTVRTRCAQVVTPGPGSVMEEHGLRVRARFEGDALLFTWTQERDAGVVRCGTDGSVVPEDRWWDDPFAARVSAASRFVPAGMWPAGMVEVDGRPALVALDDRDDAVVLLEPVSFVPRWSVPAGLNQGPQSACVVDDEVWIRSADKATVTRVVAATGAPLGTAEAGDGTCAGPWVGDGFAAAGPAWVGRPQQIVGFDAAGHERWTHDLRSTRDERPPPP